MAREGGLSDRMMKRLVPRVASGVAPDPVLLWRDVFAIDRCFVHFGIARMSARTTVLRLPGDDLVVISPPPPLGASALASLHALGEVRFLIVPNAFHYTQARAFLSAHPRAELLVAPGLGRRVPDFAGEAEMGQATPDAFRDQVECVVLAASETVSEVLLFHRPSGTLILTDLAFNLIRHERTLDRYIWRFSGIPAGFGPGRTSRTLLLVDHAAAKSALRAALAWPIQRIVVAHGEAITDNAAARFRDAFAEYLD